MLHALLWACVAFSAVSLLMLFVNLFLLPRLSAQEPAREDAPSLSIVVPARNEERAVEAGVRSLLAQEYPRFEVIVVDDRSTDGTGDILMRLAAADGRLTVVRGAEPPPGWLGKPHALWQGARRASGDLVLFVDADVRYHPQAAAQAVGYLERAGAGLVAFFPRLETAGFWEPVLMANLAIAVYFGPGFLANQDWLRLLAVGSGAGNLVRRHVYDAVGGHETLRASVIDDVRLALEAKRAGFRVRTLVATDRIAVRMYHGFREIWDGFAKNTAFVLGGLTGLAVLLLTVLSTVFSVLPPAIAAAALLGAPVSSRDAALAAASWALLLAARVALAAAIREPLWTALTQPLMSLVWGGILARSAWHRYVRRSVVWRGRSFDATKADF
ncbi:MAG TPA: glycosyltransferase [Thermoanaerobaculia bacterium]|nr:glycosyltransferase [Thermoanaerobaculia bacterium]